ncbi:MAG TPA: tetratricopeptide repeat protein, partial [Gemmataceae bacterium]|nr:tetratricopeptide repeat protein [Gemmataceae bacterium]
RAQLLSGRAGSGKTALLCDLVRRLLEEQEDHLVFFLRGDGLLRELPGDNLLLTNLLHKIGLDARKFAGFAEFFAHLEARAREDKLPGRRFVIVLDALNEAPAPEQVLREALELVSAGRAYPWLRVVLSARDEFLLVWSGRRGDLEANPFHAVRGLFVPPPEDPTRPARPEDPPAWFVHAFRPEEAETVYRRYQQAHAADPASPACRTAWEQIGPATRAGLLTVPLYLDLWMRAFDGREAPAVSGERELFEAYLADLRGRFDGFWPGMGLVLDHALRVGRMELNDADAHELRDAWQRARTEGERRTQFSPLEVACACGVMQKRTTEEGGGYRIPHQGLRELLIYERLRERGPAVGRESLRRWLGLPPLEELAGALARIAEDLWRADRAADLALLAEEAVGATALERMLAGRLERGPGDEVFRRRVREMLEALPGEPQAGRCIANLVLFDVPRRLAGLPVTEGLRTLWEAVLPWLEGLAVTEGLRSLWEAALPPLEGRVPSDEANFECQWNLVASYSKLADISRALGQGEEALRYYRQAMEIAERLCRAEPGRADFARDLSVSFDKLGDVSQALGRGEEALRYYQKRLEITERLCRAEPQRADLTWDLACSYVRLSQFGGQRHLLEQARDLLRGLHSQNRLSHQRAVKALARLEEILRTDTASDES